MMRYVAALAFLALVLVPSAASAQYSGFFIPNSAGATYGDQARLFQQDFQIIVEAMRGNGVMSGCAVSLGSPTTSIAVASGSAGREGATVTVSGGTTDVLNTYPADATNPRIYLVSINDAGTVVITAGTAAAVGTVLPPTIPQTNGINNIVLATLYIPPGVTALTSAMILDRRVFVSAVQAGQGIALNYDAGSRTTTVALDVGHMLRTCQITVGADNGSALVDADLGPQGRRCFVAAAATIVEVTVATDAGASSVQIRKNHQGTTTNLLSGALAAVGGGGASTIACARATTSATCYDGTTSSGTVTVSTTALAAGDWIELTSGTVTGGTKRMSLAITYEMD